MEREHRYIRQMTLAQTSFQHGPGSSVTAKHKTDLVSCLRRCIEYYLQALLNSQIAGVDGNELVRRESILASEISLGGDIRPIWQSDAVREQNQFFAGNSFASKGLQNFLADP